MKFNILFKYFLLAFFALFMSCIITACNGGGSGSGSGQGTAKAITAFSLNGTPGVITGQNIAVTMPVGTNVTALIATYTTSGASVNIGGTPQTSGLTANDFTNPVVYTVVAADGTTQGYTVTVTVAVAAWVNVGKPGFSAPQASFTSIAFNPANNQPYVVYQDGGNNNKATVMTFNGESWVNVGNPGFSAGVAAGTSIAFNPANNQPYVFYSDGGNGYKATVMTFNGTAWVNVGNPGFSAGVASGSYYSIAFNPANNQPYVVYPDGGNSTKATVMTFNGTAWVNVGKPGFSDGVANYTSIAFNPANNQPYVVYSGGNADSVNRSKATVMTFNGTAWVNLGNPGFSAGVAYYTSIAFNPANNQPYVVYKDFGNSTKATVMTFNGTAWVNVGKPGFSTGYADYTSIAFNPANNQPYVVYSDYQDGGYSSKATVMTFNGTAWVNVGKPEFSAGDAYSTSIAFNPANNQPYVVYREYLNYETYENNGKATVMTFN